MGLNEPKFNIMNKRYVTNIKLSEFYYKNEIYDYYQLGKLNIFPQEIIENITSFICPSLIVLTDNFSVQYINPKDNKIVKEIRLLKHIDYRNIFMSKDGLIFIRIIDNNIHIEYLCGEVPYYNFDAIMHDIYISDSNKFYYKYNFGVIDHVTISPSTKYLMRCYRTDYEKPIDIKLYETITGNIITSYNIDGDYISQVCFSPNETKIAIISNDVNNSNYKELYVFDNHQLIYKNDLISTNYNLSWTPNSKLLSINDIVNGLYYTSELYSKILNTETKEFMTDIILPIGVNSNIKWINNHTFSYLVNNNIIVTNVNTKQTKTISLTKYNLYNNLYIIDFDYTHDNQFIVLCENNFGDTIILF